MNDDDIIEKPACRVLYRQSSLETRLSPVHLSEESDIEPDDEEQTKNPKIVDYKVKFGSAGQNIVPPSRPPSEKCIIEGKSKFQEELEKKLNKGFMPNKFTNKNVNDGYVQVEPLEKIKSNSTKATVEVDIGSVFQDELKRKFQEKQKENDYEEKTNRVKPAVPARTCSASKRVDVSAEKNDRKTAEVVKDKPKTSIVDDSVSSRGPSPVSSNEKIKNSNIQSNSETSQILDVQQSIRGTTLEKAESEINNTSSVGLLKALILTKKDVQETVGNSEYNREEMATARPKSPRPVAVRGEKDESIWDKLGTLGRKKRIKEVQEVQAEGKYAIDSPGCATAPIIPPEEYNLDDNEERCMIDRRAYDDPKFNELLNVLKEWINDELASQRIIVQDLSEDLYDGQVLQKLLEKLTGDKLDVPEVTQSEEGQKQKLSVVLGHFNQVLGIQRISHNKWSVEAIHSKNIVAITHLLVALARHFRPPVRLPEHVSVDVVVVQKAKGVLNHKIVRESLTKTYDDVGMRCERDAFDTLFDHAPDKLQVVKKSLVTFVNKHLNKMNFEVTEIESQFHDGVYLIMLMGLLEGFFVPHYSFNLTPHEFDQKVHNVNFAFELMEEVGLQKPKARPEDVVNMDLKSTLRVLYNLFLKYKTIL